MLRLKELIEKAKKSAIRITPDSPLVKQIETYLSQGAFDVYEVVYPEEIKRPREEIERPEEKEWRIISPKIMDIVTPLLLLTFILIVSQKHD